MLSRRRASEDAAEFGEAQEEMGRVAAVAGALVQRLEALGIVRPAVAQMRSENLLQIGEAAEAERLRETHEGGGLHMRAAGDRRGRS